MINPVDTSGIKDPATARTMQALPTATQDTAEALREMVVHYLAAVYFTDTGEVEQGQPPGDAVLSPEATMRAFSDCADFMATCQGRGLLTEYMEKGGTWEQFGHDFWLTRCHHGAGFWDRGLGLLGDRLTEAAQQAGQTGAYLGDDGLMHME